MERIFVQIASYRDPQCGPTVLNLLRQARYPERISFGICLQWKWEDEADVQCGFHSIPLWPFARIDCQKAEDSQGACWARARCQQLWQGEEFTLQIDSHMRAEPDWDVILIDSWKRANHPKAVLSCYPNEFKIDPETGIETYDREVVPIMTANFFNEEGILGFLAQGEHAVPWDVPKAPLPNAFIAGGMIFGPGSLIRDVPYDSKLYFHGEESTLSARMWTHGYELFNPDRLVLYHLYKDEDAINVVHWRDHDDWTDLELVSLERIHGLLEGTMDLGIYGLGKERTLEQYQKWSGIDFKNKTIAEHAKQGKFGYRASVLT